MLKTGTQFVRKYKTRILRTAMSKLPKGHHKIPFNHMKLLLFSGSRRDKNEAKLKICEDKDPGPGSVGYFLFVILMVILHHMS